MGPQLSATTLSQPHHLLLSQPIQHIVLLRFPIKGVLPSSLNTINPIKKKKSTRKRVQIGRISTGVKHILHMADRELRQRANLSQLSSATVQMAEQATAQHSEKFPIKAYFNQKPSAETQNVEKATASCTEECATKGKLTLSALGTPSLDHILT